MRHCYQAKNDQHEKNIKCFEIETKKVVFMALLYSKLYCFDCVKEGVGWSIT